MALAAVGGGPPVLLRRMSTPPSSRSIFAIFASMTDKSARSQTGLSALPSVFYSFASVAPIESAPMPATATFAPLPADDLAAARPSPPPSTSAVFLLSIAFYLAIWASRRIRCIRTGCSHPSKGLREQGFTQPRSIGWQRRIRPGCSRWSDRGQARASKAIAPRSSPCGLRLSSGPAESPASGTASASQDRSSSRPTRGRSPPGCTLPAAHS